jgi:hypothetical protein
MIFSVMMLFIWTTLHLQSTYNDGGGGGQKQDLVCMVGHNRI